MQGIQGIENRALSEVFEDISVKQIRNAWIKVGLGVVALCVGLLIVATNPVGWMLGAGYFAAGAGLTSVLFGLLQFRASYINTNLAKDLKE